MVCDDRARPRGAARRESGRAPARQCSAPRDAATGELRGVAVDVAGALAARLGLRTAAKPDSQDVCFITQTGGRETFLGKRISFRKGTVVDSAGTVLGDVPAIEMVTLGQRRGIGLPGGGPKRYVTSIDHTTATVVVGDESDLDVTELSVGNVVWADEPYAGDVMVQCSAHGTAVPASLQGDIVHWSSPQRRVAPGQSVVFFDPTDSYVLGGGIAR